MQPIRRLLFVLIVVLVAAISVRGQSSNRANAEKQIVSLERALNDAFAKRDVGPFKANLAPDAVQIDGAGIAKVTPPELEKMMKQVSIQSWAIDGSQFYWVDDNTVLHLYRWSGKGTAQGQPVPSPSWASTVWANKSGKWQAVFHQETNAVAPPPATGKK